MSGFAIEDLREEHIPQSLEISKVEFGTDYLFEKDFKECIGKDDVFCRVAVLDGTVIGFCICRMFGPDKVDKELKLPESDSRDTMMSFGKIGLLDAITLRSDVQGHGYGSILAKDCYDRMLAHDVDAVCAMAWKSIRGTTNAKKLLENLGMRSDIEIQGYWNLMVDSPEGHHCPHCDPPCKCFGVLYYKRV